PSSAPCDWMSLWVKQTFAVQNGMSALPPKADIGSAQVHVRFVPEADIRVIELAKPTTQF
ncbi:MAG: hypothetical protein WBC72_21755, partial [Pseudolabrys sp.]